MKPWKVKHQLITQTAEASVEAEAHLKKPQKRKSQRIVKQPQLIPAHRKKWLPKTDADVTPE